MNIDIRYLDVKWSDKDTVLKVECSKDMLPLEQHDDHLQVESTTFKNYLPRLGFRILDKKTLHTPCFIISDTKRQELLPIVDPTTQNTWWIESSGWDNKNKYHYSEIYRTVGSVSVKVQNKTIKIVNNSLGFTVDELESYLRDFKNDLWMLILSEQSYIKGAIEKDIPSIFHPDMIKHLHDYADAIERIIKKPTNELKEIQILRPIRSVKPVNRTFMELAVKGNPKYLTSRASQETYDTSDNRYIHFTLKHVLYLIKQLEVLGGSQDNIYERIIAAEQKRLESFSDNKRVDPVVFHNEIRSITEKLNGIKESINEAFRNVSENQVDESTYNLRLTNPFGRGLTNKYFCDYLDGELFKQKHKTYLVTEFPNHIPMQNLVSSYNSIEIVVRGKIIKGKGYNSYGNEFYFLNFLTVSSLIIEDHPLSKELERLETKRDNLKKVDWVVPYSSKEKQDVESERVFLRKKVELLSLRQKSVKDFNLSIAPLVRRIRDSKLFFETVKVGIAANFPNTMVFVQNPNYSLAKTSFSKISNINGMDESIFKSMMSIDEIGLVNISNLYEKWCLLQIIKVLTEVYSFNIIENWQHELIGAVLNKRYNIQFKLDSPTLGRSIILTFEHQFEPGNPNSRRPDYVIDVFDSKKQSLGRYVLDAKFKDTLNDCSLQNLIHEMYVTKDYSQGENNKVFILHASDSAISNRTSPLNWGTNSDYGQTNRHRYGGIYLSPSYKKGRSIDNLQRLIGLFLQESNVYEEPVQSNSAHQNPFCMACGNNNKNKLSVTHKKTRSGGDKWELLCSVCNHLQVRSFCRSCLYPLDKNGYYWTYHRTRAEQPFNIVCPNCEEFL